MDTSPDHITLLEHVRAGQLLIGSEVSLDTLGGEICIASRALVCLLLLYGNKKLSVCHSCIAHFSNIMSLKPGMC